MRIKRKRVTNHRVDSGPGGAVPCELLKPGACVRPERLANPIWARRPCLWRTDTISTAMEVKFCLPSRVPCQRYTYWTVYTG